MMMGAGGKRRSCWISGVVLLVAVGVQEGVWGRSFDVSYGDL